jgi:cystathionine beta-lyase/cystathionine gamma-synthase
MGDNWGLSTISVHSGERNYQGSLTTPLFQTSTYLLSPKAYQAIEEGRPREEYIYTRWGNQNQQSVAAKVAKLEGAEDGLVFSSGLAAISSLLLALLRRGDHLLTTRDLYGGTYGFITEELPQRGIEISFTDQTDSQKVESDIKPNSKVIFFESLSNPLLKLASLPEVAQITGRKGITLVMDNTFTTPINLRPLEWGADVVLHSCTKYLNGHSDLVAGALVGKRDLLDEVWKVMVRLGGCLDPHACYLLERGMKTLALRVERQNQNGWRVAKFLEDHSTVEKVIYPGLSAYSQRELADSFLSGFGGMVTFQIKGGDSAAREAMSKLRIIKEATSLGGVESLISMPTNTSHHLLSLEEKAELGIEPGLLRLSVGIEDSDDLVADLDSALR